MYVGATFDDAKKGDLRVWWIPQVPGTPFRWPVPSADQARMVLDILAAYDRFQFENNIKPDYSNTGGLEEYDGEEWSDWYDDEGREIDDPYYRR